MASYQPPSSPESTQNGSLAGAAAGDSSHSLYDELQPVLQQLSSLPPQECLEKIAEELRNRLNCETVCILRWKEDTQQLITEHRSGMPEDLKGDEIYSLAEGITGKYVFNLGKRILGLVDFENEILRNAESDEIIEDESINWKNMRRFKESSRFNDFRSLLTVPLKIRKERVGVIKLINKISPQGESLVAEGFTRSDLNRVDFFLSTIQHVLEAKRHEEQIEALLQVNESIFHKSDDALKEIASQCVKALNYRICIIRLFDGARLTLAAHQSDLRIEDDADADSLPFAALRTNRVIKWRQADSALKSLYGARELTSYHVPKVADNYDLKTLVIVPVVQQNTRVGTIECYATVPREIGERELNVMKTFAGLVVTAVMNQRLSRLVQDLLEIQTVGVNSISVGADQEDELISTVLERIRESVGSEVALLAVWFSQSRRLTTQLRGSSVLYEVGGLVELHQALKKKDFEILSSTTESDRDQDAAFWQEPRQYQHRRLKVYRVPITLRAGGAAIGVMIMALRDSENLDTYSKQIVDFSAKSLGVALENVQSLRRLEHLRKLVVDDASRADTIPQLHDLILKGALDGFGFDYAVISTVDERRTVIRTIKGSSRMPKLVDPKPWLTLSHYSLEDKDILPWIVRHKQSVMIDGPQVSLNWDDRLNRDIFEKFGHKDLVRLYVPLINRERIKLSPHLRKAEKRELVTGVIEAGYHVNNQRTISTRHRDQFRIFINSFAENIQRLTLIEERKRVEKISEQLGKEENEPQLLSHLLELSVRLVEADSGAVMLLTHTDGRLVLGKNPILYNISTAQRASLVDSLVVQKRGKKIGLTAYATATKQPYWSNDVANDPMYLPEFDEVKSELVLPLTYLGEVIGVLDIYSYKEDSFDSKKVELLKGIADPAVKRYEKLRSSKALSSLANLSFNMFSDRDQIYEEIVKVITESLDSETVSIWEVDPAAKKGRELKLVEASKPLKRLYKSERISYLSMNSFTGESASKRETLEVTYHQIVSSRFKHSAFAKKHSLKSMTVVPIAMHETFAAIDVFSRRDVRLFPDEKSFLEVLAGKAADAIFGAKLRQALQDISEELVGGDITKTLNQVTRSVVDLLHASPVILIQYDAQQKKLLPRPNVAGSLLHQPIPNLRSPTFFNLVLEEGSLYLQSEHDYLRTLKRLGQPLPGRATRGFWQREHIKSSAGLRLIQANEIVGILWVNYKSPRIFDEQLKKFFEGVAGLTASAIYNARLLKQDRLHQTMERRYSLARTANQMATGLEHTSGNFLNDISLACHGFERKLNEKRRRAMGKSVCRKFLEDVREPLAYLIEDFDRQREYRQFGTFKVERCRIEDLIEECRRLLRKQLLPITVKKFYGPTPAIVCDKSQIKHALTNLLINSCEAIGQDGRITIRTSVTANGRYVLTRIEDNGPGIPRKMRAEVFEPFFTTKEKKPGAGLGLAEGGSGLGLSVSRFITERHNGLLKLEFPRRRRGTIAKLFLPIERGRKDDKA